MHNDPDILSDTQYDQLNEIDEQVTKIMLAREKQCARKKKTITALVSYSEDDSPHLLVLETKIIYVQKETLPLGSFGQT
jgi:hypothetical protein